MFAINDLPADFAEDDVQNFLDFAVTKIQLEGFLEISISFLTSAEICLLNAENRQREEPTDILTFALSGPVPMASLGDIYICVEQVCDDYPFGNNRQALFFVLAHGLFHLSGRTHHEAEELLTIREEQAQIVKAYEYSLQHK